MTLSHRNTAYPMRRRIHIRRTARSTVALLICMRMAAPPPPAAACGPDFPHQVLENPRASLLFPPELAFGAEVARIAGPRKPEFAVINAYSGPAPLYDFSYLEELTWRIEQRDVAGILAARGASAWERIHVTTLLLAMRAHPAALGRALLPQLAPRLPREFSLYAQGMVAYRRGDWGDAGIAWRALLALPPSERRYRSAWASYMLAKLDDRTLPDPVARCAGYAAVRAQVRGGALDTLGLAITSLGDEARCAFEVAAPSRSGILYAEQAAYETAVARAAGAPPDSMGASSLWLWAHDLFELDDQCIDPFVFCADKDDAAIDRGLAEVASHPQTAAIVTVYLAAQGSRYQPLASDNAKRWLRAVATERSRDPSRARALAPYASYMALLAYRQGEATDAAQWLSIANPTDPLALVVKGKLALYHGRMRDAHAAFTAALHALPPAPASPRLPELGDPRDPPEDGSGTGETFGRHMWDGDQEARLALLTDLGVQAVLRDDYEEGLTALLDAGYWTDAAFVAERLLSVDALVAYAEHLTTNAPRSATRRNDLRQRLRYLLARRLMREGRIVEAGRYVAGQADPTTATATATTTGIPDNDLDVAASYRAYVDLMEGQAKAMLGATAADRLAVGRLLAKRARLVRSKGMELMGTEGNPDWSLYAGAYYLISPSSFLFPATRARAIADGAYASPGPAMVPASTPARLVATPTARALRALAASAPKPNARYHYRYVAADLAWKAAAALPDRSDELADILCDAYEWLRYLDAAAARRFYRAALARTTPEQRTTCGY